MALQGSCTWEPQRGPIKGRRYFKVGTRSHVRMDWNNANLPPWVIIVVMMSALKSQTEDRTARIRKHACKLGSKSEKHIYNVYACICDVLRDKIHYI